VASGRLRRNKSLGGYLTSLDQTTSNLNTRQNYLTTGLASQSVTESSLAEELTIFNRSIQTDNYVEGASGWRISGTGDAEFGSVIIRGEVNAFSGTIGYWNISTPAVSRVIGPHTLLGTFVESSAAGGSDVDITSGTYVGLYKSYSPEEILVTLKSRTSNVSTLTAENHQFEIGDFVIVELEDDTTFNNGFIAVEITDITNDTFSYSNAGTDVSESSATGTVQLYNPDVAGLYLRDYGKREFDYGYFSSTGVAYVAAETLNLIYNPSFEFTDTNTYTVTAASASSVNIATYTVNHVSASNPFVISQKITIAGMTPSYFNGTYFVTNIGGSSGAWTAVVTATTSPFTIGSATGFGTISSTLKPSVLSWDTAASGAITSWSFISSTLRDYATASSYGGSISWTNTVPTTKFRGTIGYGVGDTYKVFETSRPLHFSYDAFLNYRPFSSTISNFVTTSSSVVTITTSGSHGLSVDDIVYLDFTATGSTGLPGGTNEDWAMDELNNNSRLFKVVTVPSTTSFTITNIQAATATAGITIGSRESRDGTTLRANNVYKVVWPAIDLSEVVFEFPNATTTSLYSVLDVTTKAAWDASTYYKYKTIDPNDWMLEFLDPVDGIPALLGNQILIDGAALRSAYATNDNTNFLLEADIKVQIPIKTYSQTYNNGVAGTYTSTTGTLHTSKANITAISYSTGTITYTAANNFAAGDYVTVTGASSSQYNITNELIATATATNFTVTKTITAGTTSTANAVANGVLSTVIDQALLSTEPVAFFGDTSASFYWKDETLNSPSQVSVQEPKKWVDIDLATQTGTLSNLDYIGFKAGYISHPMFAKPSISTIYDSSYNSSLDFGIDDYEEMRISSGIFQKADATDTTIVSFESYVRPLTGDKSAMSEMVSKAYTADASVRTYAEYLNSRVVIKGNVVHLEGALLANDIYPSNNNVGYHDTPSYTGGDLNLYGDYVNIGSPTSTTPTIFSAYGDAIFEKDITVNGISYLGEVEATSSVKVSTSTASFTVADTSGTGIWLDNGFIAVARSAQIPMYVKRQTDDGILISLVQSGSQEGTISVSGATVTYNSFLGSHYSEIAESTPPKGTIMESTNSLVENRYQSQERMPKSKISDTAASSKVYGVYLGPDYDENDQQNGHLIAAVGAGWVRIASGISIQPGDLIESNGDGCGRVQADDIIRSSTVGKVTSNVVVDTYEDGSYLVPCVLYCG
jgi:hypothetical protein